MTTPIDPNYRHPNCYANLHGGCSTKSLASITFRTR